MVANPNQVSTQSDRCEDGHKHIKKTLKYHFWYMAFDLGELGPLYQKTNRIDKQHFHWWRHLDPWWLAPRDQISQLSACTKSWWQTKGSQIQIINIMYKEMFILLTSNWDFLRLNSIEDIFVSIFVIVQLLENLVRKSTKSTYGLMSDIWNKLGHLKQAATHNPTLCLRNHKMRKNNGQPLRSFPSPRK